MKVERVKGFLQNYTVLDLVLRKTRVALTRVDHRYRILKKVIFNVVDKRPDAKKRMINIGGGNYFRRHWKVLDYPTPSYRHSDILVDFKFDLTSHEPLPFEDDSVSFFYSAHTLEHIPHEYCQNILGELYRCLIHGGVLRITLPDYDLAYDAYRKQAIGFFDKYPGEAIEEKFLDFFATFWRGRVAPEDVAREFERMGKTQLADFYTGSIPRESQKTCPGNHINWWNYEKMEKMILDAGFATVYRSGEQESKFWELRGQGRRTGFDSTHPEVSFFVEAVK